MSVFVFTHHHHSHSNSSANSCLEAYLGAENRPKRSIDCQYTMASLPPDAPKPRLCRLRKDYSDQDYGFNLHADRNRGQFIGAVDAGSPAEFAGLRTNDRIVAVNGVSVVAETHKQVVARIREQASECSLLVIDDEGEAWYRERKLPIPVYQFEGVVQKNAINGQQSADSQSPVIAVKEREQSKSMEKPQPPPAYLELTVEKLASTPEKNLIRPRLCKLIKPHADIEYGFNLHAEKNNGHFIGKVDRDSVAEKAGLEEGMRIVGVNGILIYPTTPNRDVVQIIKSDSARAELLVASPEVDQWYKKHEKEYNLQDAEIFEPVIGKFAQLTSAKASSAVVENGTTNGVHNHTQDLLEKNLMQHKEMVAKMSEAVTKVHVVPNEQKLAENGPQDAHIQRELPHMCQFGKQEMILEKPPIEERSPPKSVQRTQSEQNAVQNVHHHQHHEDWMNLTAAELRDRVSRHKKSDPRTQQLSLLQKYEIIHNL